MKILLLIVISISYIYGQAQNLSNIPSQNYTVDDFSGNIYFEEYGYNTQWVVNINTLNVSKSEFPSLPVFSHLSHKAIYYDTSDNSVKLYDYSKDNTKILIKNIKLIVTPWYSISPNDENAIIGSYVYNFEGNNYYYDSAASFDYDIRRKTEWSSDTSIIRLDQEGIITEYFLKSHRKDTISITNDTSHILSFAYNPAEDRIYFSRLLNNKIWNPQLCYFDRALHKEVVLFDHNRDESPYEPGNKIYQDLKWSKNFKLLGFIGLFATLTAADLYVFSLDSNRVFKLTDYSTNYGTKYSLNWYDSNKMIYFNPTYGLLFSFNIPSAVLSVKKNNENTFNCELSNYPNPFNNSTNISFNIRQISNAELIIYNVAGQIITKYKINVANQKSSLISWNGMNQSGQQVSSGIYFAVITTEKQVLVSNALKLLLIK